MICRFLLDLVFLGYKPPVLVQRIYPYCAGGRAVGERWLQIRYSKVP
jgi:hypothetical protein